MIWYDDNLVGHCVFYKQSAKQGPAGVQKTFEISNKQSTFSVIKHFLCEIVHNKLFQPISLSSKILAKKPPIWIWIHIFQNPAASKKLPPRVAVYNYTAATRAGRHARDGFLIDQKLII